MPLITPDISKVLETVGLGPTSNPDDDLYTKHRLSDDDVIRELREFTDDPGLSPALKLRALELAAKMKKMMTADGNVGQVSFNIVINDPGSGGSTGPNPILIPREVKL